MKKLPHLALALSLGVALGLASCNQSASDGSTPPVIENEQLPTLALDIRRSELDMRRLADTLKTQPKDLLPPFAAVMETRFFYELLANGDTTVPLKALAPELARFANDRNTQALIDSVLKRYPASYDFSALILKPLQRMKAAFPNAAIPPFRTYITGYHEEWQVTYDPSFLSDKYMGIGLHYFMGEEFTFYPPLLPRYVKARQTPQHIPVNLMSLWVDRLLPQIKRGTRPQLIEAMVRAGIRQYFLEQTCRESPDSVRFGYAGAQMKFAYANEQVIWNHLLPKLFDQEEFGYRDYMFEGPFTKAFGPECPGKIGHFIGWRIVHAYMEAHPEVTLAQLVQRIDYLEIFNASGYKP